MLPMMRNGSTASFCPGVAGVYWAKSGAAASRSNRNNRFIVDSDSLQLKKCSQKILEILARRSCRRGVMSHVRAALNAGIVVGESLTCRSVHQHTFRRLFDSAVTHSLGIRRGERRLRTDGIIERVRSRRINSQLNVAAS